MFTQQYSQMPSVVTRPTSCATRVSPGDLLLPFGQFTLCRACVDKTVCVAVRKLALRRGREMGAHCAPLRKKKILCRSHFSERSPVSGLRQANRQGKRESQEGRNRRCLPFWFLRRNRRRSCGLQPMQQFSFLLHYAIIKENPRDEIPCRSKFGSTSSVTLHRQQKFGTRSLRTVKPFRSWKSWTR